MKNILYQLLCYCYDNKGLQTEDGKYFFLEIFCEILFSCDCEVLEPWIEKCVAGTVCHDSAEWIMAFAQLSAMLLPKGRKYHFLGKCDIWVGGNFIFKFYIFGIPNPRGEYFATNPSIENDLKETRRSA